MPYKPGTNPTDPYNQDAESSAQGQDWGNLAYNAAELAAGFIPGVGEVIDAKNAYNSFQQGDYLGAGISGAAALVGVLPIAGDFAAAGLRTANKVRQASNVADAAKTAKNIALAKDVALSAAPAYELGTQVYGNLTGTPGGPQAGPVPGPTVPALDPFGGLGQPVTPTPPVPGTFEPPVPNVDPAITQGSVNLYDPGTTRQDYNQARQQTYHQDDDGNDYTGHGTAFGRSVATEYGDTTGGGEFGGTPTARTPSAPPPRPAVTPVAPTPQSSSNDDDGDDDWSAGTGWSNSSNSGWGNSAGGEFDTSSSSSNNDDSGGGGGGK